MREGIEEEGKDRGEDGFKVRKRGGRIYFLDSVGIFKDGGEGEWCFYLIFLELG